MTVKIVTDSAADIPPEILKELDISVVPLYVRFGTEVFKDGVTINNEQFYQRLTTSGEFPATSQPTPLDFQETYEKLCDNTDGIVSIHLSEKFSGTCEAARQAGSALKGKCSIEVIDSESMTIGLGMVCMTAARAARAGASFAETVKIAREAIREIHFMSMFDSLKYLVKGGRVGKAKGMIGIILNIKPLLGMKDGIVVPVGRVRSASKGIEEMYNFMAGAIKKGTVKELAIMYNTVRKEADALKERIAPHYPRKIIMGQIGPILGTHAGPNVILIGIQGELPTTP
jgi:DegV family protein with EDD domain